MYRRVTLCCAILACLLSGPAVARGQKPEARAAELRKVVVPERKIKFKVADSWVERRLPRADPKLLEHKFVVVIPFERSKSISDQNLMSLMNQLAGPIQYVPGVSSSLYFNASYGSRNRFRTGKAYLQSLADTLPDEKRVPQELLRVILEQADKGGLQFSSNARSLASSQRDDQPTVVSVSFLAESEEQARELAMAVIALFDYGLFLPTQAKVQNELLALREELRTGREKETELQKEAKAASLILQKVPLIAEETVDQLRVRQHLLVIDLAGIRARIEAINKLLASPSELANPRIDQLEELKITAEVELAGLAAQQKAIAEIIDTGEKRESISFKVNVTNAEAHAAAATNRSNEKGIKRLEELLVLATPFPLQDDTVTITAVKWVSGE